MSRATSSVWIAAAIVIVATGAAEAQSAIKIGVFDPGRVSEEAVRAKKVQADLQAIRDAKQAEIDTREEEITGLQQQISQQALSLSPDKLATMEISIQRKLLELNTAKELATRQLQLEIAAAEAKFNEQLNAAVAEFGRSEEFALILDTGSVAWAASAIDVTTAVIDQFDRMFPSSGE